MQCMRGLHCHAQLPPKLNFPYLLQSTNYGVKLRGFAFFSLCLNYSRSDRRSYPAVVAKATLRHKNKNRDEESELSELSDEEESNDKRGGEEYEHDPEAADILMGNFDDPEKMRKRIQDRIRRKEKKMFQPKKGSAKPMKVIFNKVFFANEMKMFIGGDLIRPLRERSSFMWVFKFQHLITKLTQLPIHEKPSYDSVKASKALSPSFYNIGDLEFQDKLARIWVDIGTSDRLLVDVLINALISLSSDYIGIKQLVFGGKHWGDWKEGMTSVEDGYKVYKI